MHLSIAIKTVSTQRCRWVNMQGKYMYASIGYCWHCRDILLLRAIPAALAASPAQLSTQDQPSYATEQTEGSFDGPVMHRRACAFKALEHAYQIALLPWERAQRLTKNGPDFLPRFAAPIAACR
jgi:hypothetical protein